MLVIVETNITKIVWGKEDLVLEFLEVMNSR